MKNQKIPSRIDRERMYLSLSICTSSLTFSVVVYTQTKEPKKTRIISRLVMSVVTMTMIIVAIIGLCVTGIYIAQARERARIEKIQKIKHFSDRHERLQRLLHELPPQYLSDELRALIAQQSITTLERLISLKKSKHYESYLESDKEYLNKLQNKKLELASVPVNSPEQAQEVRRLLEALFKFVQQQAQQKRLDPGRAKQYALQIKFFATKSKTDNLVGKAEATFKAGKPRAAIHCYHTAIEAFKPMSDYPAAAELIQEFKKKIKTLEQDADKQNKVVQAKAQSQVEESDQWNEFLGDDDDWKKKNSYD